MSNQNQKNQQVKQNNDGEVNDKMDMEKIREELKRSKPYAIRIPIALRLAIDRISPNASEYICQLLLKDERVKKEFLKIVNNGYNVNGKREKTNVDNLIKLI